MPGGVTSIGNFVPGHEVALGLYFARGWRRKSGGAVWRYAMGLRRSLSHHSPDKYKQRQARRKR